MTNLRFDITFPDGTRESVETDAERVLIGRGAHCEICLGVNELATEHVAVEVVGDTVRLIARAFTPAPTLNGQAVTEAIISQRAVLGIGTLSIEITRVGTKTVHAVRKHSHSRSNVVRFVGAVAAAVLFGLVALQASAPSPRAPAAVPDLWTKSKLTCPANSPAQARALAVEKRIVADGKRERHPFYVAEGVEAVALYELSANCFLQAGDDALANELATMAQQLRADVNDDYRVRRLRLERALATNDAEVASREVVMLRSLLADKQGPYAEWIGSLARKFDVDKDKP